MGVGRPAHDPQVMVALLLYAYCRGQRSARVIERECVEDVAYRVITANQRPDHTTIARFRQRHEDAIAGLFSEVLALCADAGLAGVGVLAVDGTKVHANASHHANRDYEQLAREILEEAKAIDAAEDELYGERRGDELPPELATAEGRRAWLREAKQRLEASVPRTRAGAAVAARAGEGGQAAAGGGAVDRAARERRLRGLPGARGEKRGRRFITAAPSPTRRRRPRPGR